MDLEAEFTKLDKRISKLEEKFTKKKRQENSAKVDLEGIKVDFFESNPKERKDKFTNWELVLYASLLYNENVNTKERISSLADLAKRGKKMENVVNFFTEIAKEIKAKNIDEWARIKSKEFIEYVIQIVSYFEKDGNKNYITFYMLTSDWALNQYAQAIKNYSFKKELKEADVEL